MLFGRVPYIRPAAFPTPGLIRDVQTRFAVVLERRRQEAEEQREEQERRQKAIAANVELERLREDAEINNEHPTIEKE